ncbi:hypothetical protein [Streptomyces sp. NPDC005805]|uniref:hypothetical protein n=1 Tax=Streptomyces sp. NPDC005805 TaxID=3157068 RepID=UPI0033EA9EA5
MTVTWRGSTHYAFLVVALSWLIGLGVDLTFAAASGGYQGLRTVRAADSWELLFPATAFVALTLARRLLPPLPRWRVILTDGALYTVVLLVCAGIASWAAGYDVPVDGAFAMGVVSLFNLQLPTAWLLSTWRAGRLEVVAGGTGARLNAGTRRGPRGPQTGGTASWTTFDERGKRCTDAGPH